MGATRSSLLEPDELDGILEVGSRRLRDRFQWQNERITTLYLNVTDDDEDDDDEDEDGYHFHTPAFDLPPIIERLQQKLKQHITMNIYNCRLIDSRFP